MRSGRTWLAVCGVAVATLAPSRHAAAYDPDFTHRWIGRQAVARLVALHPGEYDDALTYLDAYLDGIRDEDDTILDGDDDPLTFRVMRHFIRPTDGAGLTMFGQTFPSSFEWAATPMESNVWGYDDAIAYYRAGDFERAFKAIGHVTHLIQDATVPAHSHLDIHGPPNGDSYESYCSSQMRSDLEGDLPTPPDGVSIPEFESLEALFLATALASYHRNSVPGALSDVDTATASGVLVQMFPTVSVGWFSQAWEIPGVGALGTAFWQHEPGYFYFKQLGATAAIDRVNFSPATPDVMEFGDGVDQSMAANMARDLIPVAILHSASLLKRFIDETRGLEVTPPGPDPQPAMGEVPSGCTTGGAPAPALGPLLLAALGLRRRSRLS